MATFVNLFLHLAVSFPSHHICAFKQCSYLVLIGKSLLGSFEPYSGFLSHEHADFLILMRFISSSDPIQLSMTICTLPPWQSSA
jgi:hypothetical protein